MLRWTGCLALTLFAAALPVAMARAEADAPRPAASTIIETGKATWYGGSHAGRRTASGERFDPARMTAAHRNIPIGTQVRVTDLATGRSVVVVVNDREPPHGKRCIDLSEGAARVLGMHSRGVADVEIASVDPAASDPVEVAEAPADDGAPAPRHVTLRHGRRHTHHAAP